MSCSLVASYWLLATAITTVYWHKTRKPTRINHKFYTITYQDRTLAQILNVWKLKLNNFKSINRTTRLYIYKITQSMIPQTKNHSQWGQKSCFAFRRPQAQTQTPEKVTGGVPLFFFSPGTVLQIRPWPFHSISFQIHHSPIPSPPVAIYCWHTDSVVK